jgi:hypothetical protein
LRADDELARAVHNGMHGGSSPSPLSATQPTAV